MIEKYDYFLQPYIKAAMGRKALNIIVLDVSELIFYTDIIIILSGKSNRQVISIVKFIKKELLENGIKPRGLDGIKEGLWVLMDYEHVIFHVFLEETRNFYDIESMWIDAKRIEI